ncbi:MAG TPA: hypothetical protein VI522_00105 [Gammaproteobacteria bacterium]|nr:hypothetical protein [Gammaproteobacteria bacterium]
MKKWLVLILAVWSSLLFAQGHEETMNEYVADLIEQADGDPYLLSVPLLIAAQSEDDANYVLARDNMIPAMKDLTRDPAQYSYASWLYGRMAVAAQFMDDTSYKPALKLKLLLINEDTQEDLFKAWAYAYAGSLDELTYHHVKYPMRRLADELTLAYQGSDANKPNASDISWVWAMVLQASALNQDTKLYRHAVVNILNTGNYDTLAQAFKQNVPSSDFNLWINATAYNAAKIIDDTSNADDLESFLVVALEAADPSQADTMLAVVTAKLDQE